MEAIVQGLGPLTFLLMFGALWIGVTWLIAKTSGWIALANRFPDRPETALARFNWQSGRMGPFGARMKNILSVDVCLSGLRLSLFWLFATWSKPILVPWDQISVKSVKGILGNLAQLDFGRPEAGTLTILQSLADEIAKAAPKGRWPE